MPKCKRGKFGSPQRGTPKKGYRLDPPHPNAPPDSPESVPHINWWDYTQGKKGKGGRSGAVAIIQGVVLFVVSLLDPSDPIRGELYDEDADSEGIIDRQKTQNSKPCSECQGS